MRIGCVGVQPGRMIDQDAIRARYNALGPFLNERDRCLFAASEARAAGRGGIAAVSRTTRRLTSNSSRSRVPPTDPAPPWATEFRTVPTDLAAELGRLAGMQEAGRAIGVAGAAMTATLGSCGPGSTPTSIGSRRTGTGHGGCVRPPRR